MQYGFTDILQLLGSLGLFLFGMKVMSDALLQLAGRKMRSILASMTSNRILGVFTGFSITSVIQSSSATTLMVVSFSNAGLLTLTEAISVIMGANIGTTITAWLITILGFKVSMSSIALPLVGLGFGLTFGKKTKIKETGHFIIGFAILFIGLQFLKEAMPDLNNNPEMLSFLSQYTEYGYLSLLLFLLIGTVLTVVIQSSSATMALTLIMCAQGWIPFEMAAAMVLGENVGTTITANLAAMVSNYQAKRTAFAHLIFNLLGVIWVLILFYPFMKLVSWLTIQFGSASPYISAAAIPVAISLFHTCFNVLNTFLLIWFVKPISKIVERVIKPTAPKTVEIDQPKFLSKSAAEYPETAIHALIQESKNLYNYTVFEIVVHALSLHRADIKSKAKAKKIVKKSQTNFEVNVRKLYQTKIKTIYGEIIQFATHTQSQLQLTEQQNHQVSQIKVANRKMVEVVRWVKELGENVSKYMNSDNENITKIYNKFRRDIVKLLRIIYLFRTENENGNGSNHYQRLLELKQQAEVNIHQDNEAINKLIRNQLISANMASSLVNDHDNFNNLIKGLIEVAELLYADKDSLLENGDSVE
jgi:phosphate:Na+ symporter